jgi:hypothetical protein
MQAVFKEFQRIFYFSCGAARALLQLSFKKLAQRHRGTTMFNTAMKTRRYASVLRWQGNLFYWRGFRHALQSLSGKQFFFVSLCRGESFLQLSFWGGAGA